MSHGSVAKNVREHKEAHPERYCADKRCLWRKPEGALDKDWRCPHHKGNVMIV